MNKSIVHTGTVSLTHLREGGLAPTSQVNDLGKETEAWSRKDMECNNGIRDNPTIIPLCTLKHKIVTYCNLVDSLLLLF